MVATLVIASILERFSQTGDRLVTLGETAGWSSIWVAATRGKIRPWEVPAFPDLVDTTVIPMRRTWNF
jgi:hypothetical protein